VRSRKRHQICCLRKENTMTDEVSDATRLVRQTFERLIEEHPGATNRQLLKLLKLAARADSELKEAAFEWTNWDRFRELSVRVRRPLKSTR
jgi:hypothetical protein